MRLLIPLLIVFLAVFSACGSGKETGPVVDPTVATTATVETTARPFDIAGRSYTGQVLLFAKNASRAITIGIETTGAPESVDVERVKTLARALLQ